MKFILAVAIICVSVLAQGTDAQSPFPPTIGDVAGINAALAAHKTYLEGQSPPDAVAVSQVDDIINANQIYENVEPPVASQFRESGLSPAFFRTPPSSLLQVNWATASAQLGNELTIAKCNSTPTFSWPCKANKYYSIFMTDVDPLGRTPYLSQVRYFFWANIQGCNQSSGYIHDEYLPPTPIYDTLPHRYAFAAYEYDAPITFEEPRSDSTNILYRVYTSVQQLADKWGLGDPCAGNFVLIPWDNASFSLNFPRLQVLPTWVRDNIGRANLAQPH